MSAANHQCAECDAGDHSLHQPQFGGICIGCTCSVRPEPAPAATQCPSCAELRDEVASLRHHVVATGDAGEMAVDVAKGLRDQRDDAAKKRDEYRATIEAMDRVFRRLCRSVGVTPSPSLKPQVLEDAVEALKKTAAAPCAPKTVGEALCYLAWAVGEDHGASSSTMFTRLTGLPSDDGSICSAPSDMDDLGRCVRLVERFPRFAQNLECLRGISSQWDHIVSNWQRLVQAYQHHDADIVREVLR